MVSNAQIRKQARQMLGGGIFQQQWLFALNQMRRRCRDRQ